MSRENEPGRRDFLKSFGATGVAALSGATASSAAAVTSSASTSSGYPRTFTGPALKMISFPLGGVGAGSIGLGGRGQLRDWEIFNRPGKGKGLPFTFFAIWARAAGGEPVARVLERRLLPP